MCKKTAIMVCCFIFFFSNFAIEERIKNKTNKNKYV